MATLPENELERAVKAARDGTGSLSEFVSLLVRSQVFVLLRGDPPTDLDLSRFEPLVLESSQGLPSVCLFTSPERSRELQLQHPEFRTGLLVDFRWILSGIPPQLGIVLNPNSDLSLEQPPEGVALLKADLTGS